jgi:uncharacterized cupredoxin-like copper-binding protein
METDTKAHTGRHAAAVALAALALGAAPLVAAACGATSNASTGNGRPARGPASNRVQVDLGEFHVSPGFTHANAGRVTFDVRNTGNVPHEMVVIRTGKPASGLAKGSRADETGNLGETGDLRPGASRTVSFRMKPGHYALICNLPGHYRSGMYTDFTVGS